MANDNLEDLKNSKRPATSANAEIMDIDDLIQENGKHCMTDVRKHLNGQVNIFNELMKSVLEISNKFDQFFRFSTVTKTQMHVLFP